jgi:hypothetical protein
VNPPTVSQGRLSKHIPTERIVVEIIIAFLADQLEGFPTWLGTRPDQNEDYYNQRLERFLQVRSRKYLDAIQFDREMIHKTPGRHDIGVFPSDEEGLVVHGRVVGPDEPIYTIECKRLPQPSDRRREYVTSEAGRKPRGAMQRYKLCIHGAGLNAAGIVGYVQGADLESVRKLINGWVNELIAAPVDDCRWSAGDCLKTHRKFKRGRKTLVSRSENARIQGGNIRLTHFLVDLRDSAQDQFAFPEEEK